jgi:acyl-coenzyme A synthetase/AMP-(fatty) acid ligase
VGIYMGMVPELPVAMLACARIGAAHSVVFGGFSAEAVSDRMNDSRSVCLITQDEAWRRGSTVPLKRNVDEALTKTETIRTVVVVRRTGNDVPMQEGRDHWYHELVAGQDATCEPEAMDSEDLLFTLYTSGTRWITFTPELPKTRSGKIMRRLLRDISENRKLGDTTTLADVNVVNALQSRAKTEADKES